LENFMSTALPAHQWRSPLLGIPRALELPSGRIECFERGTGPTVVFAHGWLANANLWRKVVDALADRFRCIALDLPFASHRIPMPREADLSMRGCASLVTDALDALDARDVTLVGNDSGGAYSQVAVAARPDRVRRLVLNACETIEDAFPPEPFTMLPKVAERPETLRQALSPLEDRAIRLTPPAYGLLLKHPTDDAALDSYVLPCLRDDAILHDGAKVMRGADTQVLVESARRLIAELDRPVLFAWPREDRVFPIAHAERYAEQLRRGCVVPIDDAYSFTPEDRPEALARAIAAFAG
jgi:pimeloyl-ACP methyl ester carboxylesterase